MTAFDLALLGIASATGIAAFVWTTAITKRRKADLLARKKSLKQERAKRLGAANRVVSPVAGRVELPRDQITGELPTGPNLPWSGAAPTWRMSKARRPSAWNALRVDPGQAEMLAKLNPHIPTRH